MTYFHSLMFKTLFTYNNCCCMLLADNQKTAEKGLELRMAVRLQAKVCDRELGLRTTLYAGFFCDDSAAQEAYAAIVVLYKWILHIPLPYMTSANRQQPILQYVDVVNCRQIWSRGRSWRYVTLSGCRHSHTFHRLSDLISSKMCHSPVWKWFNNDWKGENWKQPDIIQSRMTIYHYKQAKGTSETVCNMKWQSQHGHKGLRFFPGWISFLIYFH